MTESRGPYQLATRGKTPAEAAQWWRAQGLRAWEERMAGGDTVPSGFMCETGPDNRNGKLHWLPGEPEPEEEYYHQGHLGRRDV
jgi:hypothetical protein